MLKSRLHYCPHCHKPLFLVHELLLQNNDRNGMDPDTGSLIGIFCSDTESNEGKAVITRIDLSKNNLAGSGVPLIMGYLTSLVELSLPRNRLTSPMNDEAMQYLSNLRVLDMNKNGVSGSIPTTIGNMASLGKSCCASSFCRHLPCFPTAICLVHPSFDVYRES
jgi:hypothetical protein